jgi:hypothetical protein
MLLSEIATDIKQGLVNGPANRPAAKEKSIKSRGKTLFFF